MILSLAILAFVTAQRLMELVVARWNTRRLLAMGGVESGAAHYPAIVALHAAWLAGLWLLAWDRPVHPGWLAAFAVVELLRVWTLASIGRRWTTRIITVPGERLVRRGPTVSSRIRTTWSWPRRSRCSRWCSASRPTPWSSPC